MLIAPVRTLLPIESNILDVRFIRWLALVAAERAYSNAGPALLRHLPTVAFGELLKADLTSGAKFVGTDGRLSTDEGAEIHTREVLSASGAERRVGDIARRNARRYEADSPRSIAQSGHGRTVDRARGEPVIHRPQLPPHRMLLGRSGRRHAANATAPRSPLYVGRQRTDHRIVRSKTVCHDTACRRTRSADSAFGPSFGRTRNRHRTRRRSSYDPARHRATGEREPRPVDRSLGTRGRDVAQSRSVRLGSARGSRPRTRVPRSSLACEAARTMTRGWCASPRNRFRAPSPEPYRRRGPQSGDAF
jgi:hypothetical protein